MGIPAENGPMHQNDYFVFAPSSPNFFLMAIIAAFGFKINFENCIYFKCGAAK